MVQENQGLLSGFLKRRRYVNAAKYIRNNSEVLDIGSGEGGFHEYISEKIKIYTGADIIKQIKFAQGEYVEWNVCEPVPTKLKDRKFDAIVSLALIEHIKDITDLLKKLKKVLKPKGIIIITTPHPTGRKLHDFGAKFGIFSSDAAKEHESFISREEIIILSKKAGLRLIKYNRFLFGFNQIFILSHE